MQTNILAVFLLVQSLLPSCRAALAMRLPKTLNVDLVGLGSHVGAAVGASAELVEDYESIGHGHGMLLLGGSKLCRELNVIREAIVEEAEDVEETTLGRVVLKPLAPVFWLLTSKAVSVSLALAALAAAFLEVLEDASPGGHHGAVLLAMNELLDLLAASRIVRGRFLRLLENQFLRLPILAGAAALALYETLSPFGLHKVGGHHGVFTLAFFKTLRCVGLLRSNLKEKEE